MKSILTIFAIAAIFAACKSNTRNDQKSTAIGLADTVGLYEYQMLKEKQAREKDTYLQTQGLADENADANSAPAVKERIVYVDRPAKRTSSATTRTSTAKRNSGSSSGTNNSGSGTVAQAPAKNEGWSKAAKGTAIGAGSGAVLGAIISKKKGKGAIIGGVIGAAGGYAIGRSKDKKDGRY